MKKAWVMVLSVLMLVTMSTAATFADSATKLSARTDTFSFENGKSLKSLKKEAKQYPSSFDLRHVDTDGDGKADSSFVTPVKVQNPYGTCWGFAAAATAESSILSNSKLNRDKQGRQLWSTSMDQHYNAENKGGDGLPMLDVSEKQFAYFSTSYLNDPGNSQNGEGMHYRNLTKEDKETSAYRYNRGGYNMYATTLFASGTGPSVERGSDGTYNDILVYRGKNKKTVDRENTVVEYDANNKPSKQETVPVWYSDKDDWSMPEVSRLLQDYSLKDSFVLPTPAGTNSNGGYEYVPEGTLAIKQQLCEHNRAVSITYHAESFLPGQDTTEAEYMSSHWAHYTNQKDFTNHVVTIVGWDDNYPKENFKSEPPGNGAWLVKNSWGSELNEFPNNGYRHWGLLEGEDKVPYDKDAKSTSMKATGYFWLSYYDQTLESPETFEFDRAVSGYYVDQMDYLLVVDTIKSEAKGCKMANVFQARETSNLSGFSVMTQTPGTKVDYEIYLLPDTFKNPQDGKKVTRGTETFAYGGYHKINLRNEQQAVLKEGQKYSVVIRESSENGDYVNYGAENSDSTVEIVAIINPGESYYYDGKNWNDQSKKKTQDMLIPPVYRELGLDEGIQMDNFPIKAYVEPITQKDTTGKTTTKNLYSGPRVKVKAKGNKKFIISWPKVKTADGYEVYLSRSNKTTMKRVKTIKGNKTFKWTKKGLKKGKLYKVCVKAYRMEKGKKIYVMKSPVMYSYTGGSKRYTNAKSVKVKKSKVTLKAGKTSKIKAKVRKLKKGKKLVSSKRVAKLRYLSSNPGVAKVSKSGKITAVKKGRCKVYVYAHNGVYKTVTVTVR